jgi:hypothetical protein
MRNGGSGMTMGPEELITAFGNENDDVVFNAFVHVVFGELGTEAASVDADDGIVLRVEILAAEHGFGYFARAWRVGTLFEGAGVEKRQKAAQGFRTMKFAAMEDAVDRISQLTSRRKSGRHIEFGRHQFGRRPGHTREIGSVYGAIV